jgi:carboxypeptidase C (cathepsin A)
MTGGPGCSSELAVFFENGPYSINHDMTLSETQYGWDRFHTTIFVDQPVNTGFSFSNVSDLSSLSFRAARARLIMVFDW